MQMLYGSDYTARSQAIAAQILDHEEIVDVCCGRAALYTEFLYARPIKYLGLDLTAAMLRSARRDGASVQKFDVWIDPIPPADVIVMQSSLCQFIPRQREILDKLLMAARRLVIVAEPVRNMSSSHSSILSAIAKALTSPPPSAGQYQGQRFTDQSFLELLESYPEFISSQLLASGRERVALLNAKSISKAVGNE